jgi:hypothetical protein
MLPSARWKGVCSSCKSLIYGRLSTKSGGIAHHKGSFSPPSATGCSQTRRIQRIELIFLWYWRSPKGASQKLLNVAIVLLILFRHVWSSAKSRSTSYHARVATSHRQCVRAAASSFARRSCFEEMLTGCPYRSRLRSSPTSTVATGDGPSYRQNHIAAGSIDTRLFQPGRFGLASRLFILDSYADSPRLRQL